MTMSIENYYHTTRARRDNGLRLYDGKSQESLILQKLKPRFASFVDAFPIYLPRYAMSFEGSFTTCSPEDQHLFTGAIFAGLIVENVYSDVLSKRAHRINSPVASEDNLWLSYAVTKTTKKILDEIGIETTENVAYTGSSKYDPRIAKHAFLTADNNRILIDPTLMLNEPCDISPAGLMRSMDGRTYMDTQPEAGAVYDGLNMKAKYYSKIKPYPEAWYRY